MCFTPFFNYFIKICFFVCSLGQVLIGERTDWPGSWQCPQGGLDPGETSLEAVKREIFEEMGISSGLLKSLALDSGSRLCKPFDYLFSQKPKANGKRIVDVFRGQSIHVHFFLWEDADLSILNFEADKFQHPEFAQAGWVNLIDFNSSHLSKKIVSEDGKSDLPGNWAGLIAAVSPMKRVLYLEIGKAAKIMAGKLV